MPDEDDEESSEEGAGGKFFDFQRNAVSVCKRSLHGFSAGVNQQQLVDALMQATGRKKPELLHVDMGAKLKEAGLDGVYPACVWPPVNPTRKLLTRINKMLKSGIAKPHASVDLRESVHYLRVGVLFILRTHPCADSFSHGAVNMCL